MLARGTLVARSSSEGMRYEYPTIGTRRHRAARGHACTRPISVFGTDKTSTRLVFGMASLPVGVCVVLESIFEIRD